MSTSKLCQAFAALDHKHNAHSELPLHVFESNKVLWTLEDAHMLCQDNNYLFLLSGNDIEKSISVIARLQVEHAVVTRVTIFHRLSPFLLT
jgi:hypothetical protein